MCMSDAGTPQDNFILPAPPVGGLPISQDWLDRMKLVRNRTIPITLPSAKIILDDTMFQISIGLTNMASAFSFFSIPIRLGTQQTMMSLLSNLKKTHFRITIPIKGCSSFIDCKVWRHESESVFGCNSMFFFQR